MKLSEGTKQQDLIITPEGEPEVTVDDIEVAQFVYLLLHNEKIRDVIDTVGKKGVLLLGRFTEGRIAVLDRLREELRKRGYLPIVFNFDKPETKDFTETVRLLAGLSKFVIADITNPNPRRSNCKRRCRRSWFRSAPSSRKARSRSPCCRTCGSSIATGCFEPSIPPRRAYRALDEKIIRPAEVRGLSNSSAEGRDDERKACLIRGVSRLWSLLAHASRCSHPATLPGKAMPSCCWSRPRAISCDEGNLHGKAGLDPFCGHRPHLWDASEPEDLASACQYGASMWFGMPLDDPGGPTDAYQGLTADMYYTGRRC